MTKRLYCRICSRTTTPPPRTATKPSLREKRIRSAAFANRLSYISPPSPHTHFVWNRFACRAASISRSSLIRRVTKNFVVGGYLYPHTDLARTVVSLGWGLQPPFTLPILPFRRLPSRLARRLSSRRQDVGWWFVTDCACPETPSWSSPSFDSPLNFLPPSPRPHGHS